MPTVTKSRRTRTCTHPGCGTVLAADNRTPRCSLHPATDGAGPDDAGLVSAVVAACQAADAVQLGAGAGRAPAGEALAAARARTVTKARRAGATLTDLAEAVGRSESRVRQMGEDGADVTRAPELAGMSKAERRTHSRPAVAAFVHACAAVDEYDDKVAAEWGKLALARSTAITSALRSGVKLGELAAAVGKSIERVRQYENPHRYT